MDLVPAKNWFGRVFSFGLLNNLNVYCRQQADPFTFVDQAISAAPVFAGLGKGVGLLSFKEQTCKSR